MALYAEAAHTRLRETEASHTRLREKDGLETLHPAVTRTCCVTRAYVGDLGIVVRAATLSFWLAARCLPEPVVRGLFDALLTFFLRTVDRFLRAIL